MLSRCNISNFVKVTKYMIMGGTVCGGMVGAHSGYTDTKDRGFVGNIFIGTIGGGYLGAMTGACTGLFWMFTVPTMLLRASDRGGIDRQFFEEKIPRRREGADT